MKRNSRSKSRSSNSRKHSYPRAARISETVREVVAEELVRIDDDVYAIGDTCSHANVSLSEGEVRCDQREIECWKHGSSFSLVTGNPDTLPATRPVPVYVARVVDGMVHVDVETTAGGAA